MVLMIGLILSGERRLAMVLIVVLGPPRIVVSLHCIVCVGGREKKSGLKRDK